MTTHPLPDDPQPLQEPLFHTDAQRRLCLVLIAAVVLAAYAAGLSGEWFIGKDAALYLNLARNLQRGEGYSLAGQPHAHVPPGFPALLAGLMRPGAGSFLALNIVMAVLGLLTVLASYLLLAQLVHRDWAMLLAGLMALTNEMLQRSGEALSDVPFTLLVVTALWLYYRGLRPEPGTPQGPDATVQRPRPCRRGWEAASLLLVAACWVRIPGFVVAVLAAIGLVISAWRTARVRAMLAASITLIGTACTLAFFGAWYRAYHDPAASSYAHRLAGLGEGAGIAYRLRMVLDNLDFTLGDLSRLYLVQEMPTFFCLVLLAGPLLTGLVLRLRRRDWLGPVIVIGYIGGLSLLSGLRTRHLLPLLPLLLLYLLEGYGWGFYHLAGLLGGHLRRLHWLIELPATHRRPPVARATVVAVAAMLLGLNLPLALRGIIQKHQEGYLHNQQKGAWHGTLQAAQWLNARKPIQGDLYSDQVLSFLADVPAPRFSRSMLGSCPPPEELAELLRRRNIRYVAVNVRGEATEPLDLALNGYLLKLGVQPQEFGKLLIFAVPAELPATLPGRPSP